MQKYSDFSSFYKLGWKENCFKINFSDINEIENFISSKNIKLCIFLVVQRSPEICEDNWNEIKITNIDMVNNISFVCNKFNIWA